MDGEEQLARELKDRSKGQREIRLRRRGLAALAALTTDRKWRNQPLIYRPNNEHLRSSDTPPELAELRELAQTINRLRARLGEVPFPLHQEFESARGRAEANDPGEPKQAQAWLQRLRTH
jgi:hypothetical protein